MLRLRRILFPTDFSALSDRALDYALELAGRFGAEIHMLHAVVLHADDPNDPLHHFPDAEEIGRRLEEIADQRMESRVAEWKGEGRPVVVRARRRGISTAPVILEYAAEIDADLVVMSTHGRRGLSHILMGSVTEEVVRLSACPVLTVRGREATSEVPRPGTILVPVDFSGHAATALAHARELAAVYGSRVRVLHVFERPMHPEIYIGGMPLESLEFGRVEGGLREALETFVREAPGPDVETELHIVEGRAAPEILSFAGSGQAELVVIATHGLTGMTHMLLGSVTEKVVRRAPCPVLTVKSFGHSLVA